MRTLETDAEELWFLSREARGCLRGNLFDETARLSRAIDRLRCDTKHDVIAIRAQQTLVSLQQQAIDKERDGMFPVGTPVLVEQWLGGGTKYWAKAHVCGHNMLAGTCLVEIDGSRQIKAVEPAKIKARDANTGSAA